MKLKNISQNICLLVLSCAISVIVLEGGSRVYLYGIDSLLPHIMDSIHNIGVSGLIQASDDPDILYELKPNLVGYFKKTRFLTNNQGLRDKNYNIQKSDNAFRVAVIGDSFSMPAGVAIEDSYHSILEKRLSVEYPNKIIEFINFSVGGYNLKQYVAVLEHKAMAYQPDLILIGFCTVNDWYELKSYKESIRSHKPYQVKPVLHPFFESCFIQWFKKILADKRVTYFHSSPHRSSGSSEDLRQRVRADMEGMFNRIHKLLQSKRIPVVVVALNTTSLKPKRSAFLKSIVEKNELYFLDATQAFKGLSQAHFQIYRSDTHPNARANQIFADYIYVFLKDLLARGIINI